MNTIAFPAAAWPGGTEISAMRLALLTAGKAIRAILRATVLAVLFPLAVADAAWQRLVTTPTGIALAYTRAA